MELRKKLDCLGRRSMFFTNFAFLRIFLRVLCVLCGEMNFSDKCETPFKQEPFYE